MGFSVGSDWKNYATPISQQDAFQLGVAPAGFYQYNQSTGSGYPLWSYMDPSSNQRYVLQESGGTGLLGYKPTYGGMDSNPFNVSIGSSASLPFGPGNFGGIARNDPGFNGELMGGNALSPKAIPDIPTGTSSTVPASPTATSLDLYNAFRSGINQPSPYTPQYTQATPQTFYDNQKTALRNALRQEFFGGVGKAQQAASQNAAMGIGDSGVGARLLQETVTTPFANAYAQIDRDVQNQQIQEQQAVNQYNSQLALEAAKFNDQMRQTVDNVAMQLLSGQLQLNEQELNALTQSINADLAQQQLQMQALQVMAPYGATPELFGMTTQDLANNPDLANEFSKIFATEQKYFQDYGA